MFRGLEKKKSQVNDEKSVSEVKRQNRKINGGSEQNKIAWINVNCMDAEVTKK